MTPLKPFIYPKSKKLPSKKLFRVYKTLIMSQGHQNWWPGETPFEVIVGAILTQNTAWGNVEKAISNLKKNKLLSPAKMRKLSVSQLASYIRPAGYFNVKADRLLQFIGFFYRAYRGSIQRMFRERTPQLRRKLLS